MKQEKEEKKRHLFYARVEGTLWGGIHYCHQKTKREREIEREKEWKVEDKGQKVKMKYGKKWW